MWALFTAFPLSLCPSPTSGCVPTLCASAWSLGVVPQPRLCAPSAVSPPAPSQPTPQAGGAPHKSSVLHRRQACACLELPTRRPGVACAPSGLKFSDPKAPSPCVLLAMPPWPDPRWLRLHHHLRHFFLCLLLLFSLFLTHVHRSEASTALLKRELDLDFDSAAFTYPKVERESRRSKRSCYRLPYGVTDPCESLSCPYQAWCVPTSDGKAGRCICRKECYDVGDSTDKVNLCGTDGKDYTSMCELRRAACKNMINIEIKYRGKCGRSATVIRLEIIGHGHLWGCPINVIRMKDIDSEKVVLFKMWLSLCFLSIRVLS